MYQMFSKHKGGSTLMNYTSVMTSGGLYKTLSPPCDPALFTAVILLSVTRLLRTQSPDSPSLSLFLRGWIKKPKTSVTETNVPEK